MKNLELNRLAIYFVILVLLTLFCNGFILIHVLHLHAKTLAVQLVRQESLQITRDIQEETSALSKIVRAYTTSANIKYLTYYYNIIDIRQGVKAPPDAYDGTYWAKVMAGERVHVMPSDRQGVSLLERMRTHRFSSEEFAAIDRVLAVANQLYELDQIAFAAAQGLYDPKKKAFVDDGEPQLQFANELTYSTPYLQMESKLIHELEDFSNLTDKRTRKSVGDVSMRLQQSIFIALVILGVTVVSVLIAIVVIRKMVLAPMKSLMRSTLELGKGNYSKRANAEQGVSEIRALGQTFNAMAQNIHEDILQREQIRNALEVANMKAEESTRAKSLFLANMSHEIRTPMNAIIGMSYLSLNTNLNELQRDYVTKIQNAAQTLLGIISDILDYSKIEAGKMKINNIAFCLEDVICNTLILLRPRAQEKGLELLLDIQNAQLLGDSGKYIGDPLRLGQVLSNLLSNALKFTDHGFIKISVEERLRHGENCEVSFCVEDTGIGMTPAQLDMLFQEFSQIDGTATRKQGGTGLGLSISKRLVNQMGGQLSVTSQPDKGSQFTFILPFHTLAETPSISLPCHGQKALIVDDHEPARTVLSALLGHFGLESVETTSGDEALWLLAQPGVKFDFIFIDWVMPGMGGEEFLTIIKKQSLQPPPLLVVVSAYDLERIHALCRQQSMCRFLAKPVLPTELRQLFAEASNPQLRDTTGALSLEAVPLRGMRILLVEDNQINQQVASELLTSSGAAVDIANNGQEAIDRISTHADDYYNAVLMDLQMPIMDGYTATKIIRSQQKYKDLPIIAMTAHVMEEEQKRCRDIGMNAHLAKPIEPITLLQVLTTHYPVLAPSSLSETPPQVVATSIANPNNNNLPSEIPGIDMQVGLGLCANKPSLYHKVLRGFTQNYQDIADTLRQHLAKEEWEEVFRLAHTFKGLTGTIGAKGLQELAAQIEKGGREHAPHLETLIKELAEQVSITMEVLQKFFLPETAPTAIPKPPPFRSTKEFRLHIEQLRQLLEESDSEAQDFWKEHATIFQESLPPMTYKEIAQAIAVFQFQVALENLPVET